MTAGPCGASAEPLVESRAHDPGVKLLGERLRLLQETEPHRRIHPNLKVGVRIETHDRKPALLHTWDRRFEPVTLKALLLSPGQWQPFFPGPIGGFSPRLEPRGYDGRDRRRQNAWRVVLQDMDIVLSYEQRQGMFDQIKPLFGIQPRRRRFEALEPQEDDPIDLGQRVRRHHRLFDEAGECRDGGANAPLPGSEFFFLAGAHPRLGDDAHSAGRCPLRDTHDAPSLSKIRSGVKGKCGNRTPVALAIAGATGLIAHSPCAFAPNGPIASCVSAKNTCVRRTPAKAECGSCATPGSPSCRCRHRPCSR
jgi:hypothetical protein